MQKYYFLKVIIPILLANSAIWAAPGRIEIQNNESRYILSAPHGGFDLYTDVVAESVCREIKWSCIIASGYRGEGEGPNVNRPTQGVKGETPSKEAQEVFEKYVAAITSLHHPSEILLYVEIHAQRANQNIEVAAVGFSSDELANLKKIMTSNIQQAGLTNTTMAVEMIDPIKYKATQAKKIGTLSMVKRALHLEVPSRLPVEEQKQLIEFFKISL